MFRHFVHHRLLLFVVLSSFAVAGCSDDESQARIDSLRDSLATVNAEAASLRASRQVLQTRLAATRLAARTAGEHLHRSSTKLAQLAAREAALSEANSQGAQRLRAAETAIAHFEGELAAASRALSASEAKNAALSRQLAAVSGWLGQRDALGQSQNNALKEFEGELKRREDSLATLKNQLRTESEALQRASADATQLRASNARLDARLSALQSKFDEMSTRAAQRVAELQRERDELSAQASSARSQAQSVQANVQQLRDNNEQIKERMESLRNELVSANDSALRYQVAKDYLVEKVQAQELEINALKTAASEARSQHKATIATMIEQQDELRTAAANGVAALQKARTEIEILQVERDEARARIEQLQLDYAASEQRARGAKQAKDYLDGKLSATAKELEDARAEHRMALLKIEHALSLSLEESRVLQQREREMREKLTDVQQTSRAEVNTLRTQLDTSGQDLDALKTKISGLESALAQLRTLRDEGAASVSAAQVELAAAIKATASAKAQTRACTSARAQDTTMIRDLQLGNETLLQQIETLKERVRVLEALQSQCKLQKTTVHPVNKIGGAPGLPGAGPRGRERPDALDPVEQIVASRFTPVR